MDQIIIMKIYVMDESNYGQIVPLATSVFRIEERNTISGLINEFRADFTNTVNRG